jgi:WD40 repeat protein
VIWDAHTGAQLLRVCVECKGVESGIVTAAFAPDGQTFATGGLDGRARVWRAADGQLLAELRHEATVMSVAFAADGRHLATGSADKIGRVWELAPGAYGLGRSRCVQPRWIASGHRQSRQKRPPRALAPRRVDRSRLRACACKPHARRMDAISRRRGVPADVSRSRPAARRRCAYLEQLDTAPVDVNGCEWTSHTEVCLHLGREAAMVPHIHDRRPGQ